MSQNLEVLAYMKEHGAITPMDALKLGCFRLAARIYDLRWMGYKIECERVTKRGKNFARYTLIEE